ncbi:unnamed protein product, partial [Chrysoparadoxa australica]
MLSQRLKDSLSEIDWEDWERGLEQMAVSVEEGTSFSYDLNNCSKVFKFFGDALKLNRIEAGEELPALDRPPDFDNAIIARAFAAGCKTLVSLALTPNANAVGGSLRIVANGSTWLDVWDKLPPLLAAALGLDGKSQLG